MEQNCIPLLLLSSIFHSPPLIRSYIFLNTLYIKFYGEILYESLAEFFAILFYHRYTLNTSNWKYSTRAPCFYIFAFAIGFFRRWLSKPSPPSSSPFRRCVWNSSCVCVHPPRRFAETFPSPIFIFPPRIVSKLLDRRIRTFILPLSGIRAFAFPFVYVTWLQLSVNFSTSTTFLPSLFPCNDRILLPPSLPFNYNPLRNLSSNRNIRIYRFNRRSFFSSIQTIWK